MTQPDTKPEVERIPESEWKWYGLAAHFICGDRCQFHLATTIGGYLVSTIGAMLSDSSVREINAKVRGIELEGKGDAREADYMQKLGFENIGAWGKYETMVFPWNGTTCDNDECNFGARCGSPMPSSYHDVDGERYDSAADAAAGHYKYCELVALGKIGREDA